MKATPASMRNAKALRRAMTLPEVLLWRLLRRSPNGIKFRRQYAVGPYVADFYCPARKLVIEVDGFAHGTGTRGARDELRDQWLAGQGLEVMRLPAHEVLADVSAVADALLQYCGTPGPSTPQLR